jgi:hypothetical protein
MNKTNFKRILRLYKEGLTTEMAINLIIMLSKNPDECSEYILKFMEQEVFPRWVKHNMTPVMDYSPR